MKAQCANEAGEPSWKATEGCSADIVAAEEALMAANAELEMIEGSDDCLLLLLQEQCIETEAGWKAQADEAIALVDEMNIPDYEDTLCAFYGPETCDSDILYNNFLESDAPKEFPTPFSKEPAGRNNENDVCPNFVPTSLMAGDELEDNIAYLAEEGAYWAWLKQTRIPEECGELQAELDEQTAMILPGG